MKTRAKTTIKVVTLSDCNMDLYYPKGTNLKGIVLDLINWAAGEDLDYFQDKINERIDFIRLNN